MAERDTTTRAYTLKLQCASNKEGDKRELWRKLWLTHEAVNKGARVFGDWLLTLRGGLNHELADKYEDGKKTSDFDKKNRRILLALSWLSVESRLGAPEKHIVAAGDEPDGKRIKAVMEVFKKVLGKQGMKEKEIQSWVTDCEPSLSSAIRPDAVWINRNAIFENAGKGFSQEDIWDMLEYFFNGPDSYLAHEMNVKEREESDDSEESASETKKVKDMVQKAGNWLSKRFGEGKGTSFKSFIEVYKKISEWAANSSRYGSIDSALPELIKTLKKYEISSQDLNGVQNLLKGPGYKSGTKSLLTVLSKKKKIEKEDWNRLKEKALIDIENSKIKDKKGKGPKPYSNAIRMEVEKECGITYLQKDGPSRHKEFCVILDHAARRVALAHTWIKKAEAERRKFEVDASCKEKIDKKTVEWLDLFCERRGEEGGSPEPIRIRRRAIDGWEEIVKAWFKKACVTEEDRLSVVKNLQTELEKFGDAALFERLALDDARIVWSTEGRQDAEKLKNYVKFKEAEAKKREYKVPAYRHPDMYLHPVFCDFGYSRWDICYALHDKRRKTVNPQDYRNITLKLFNGKGLDETELKWQSKKFMKDIAATFNNSGKGIKGISRADRQGMAVAGETDISKVRASGVFEAKNWNGRLQAPRPELERLCEARQKGVSEKKIAKMIDNINWLLSFSAEVEKKGPWLDLEKANKGIKLSIKYGYNDDKNRKRGMHSRIILARLPGIRVLSVDLGHRYAAACAVWEAVSEKQLENEGVKISKKPFIFHKTKKDGKEKTTIYRRIGPDELGKGRVHPAPWARLDRQFLIKLQGEDKPARMADEKTEYNKLREIASKLGYKNTGDLPWDVDALMREACHIIRLALRRNGMLAKAAYNMTSTYRIKPGNIKEIADEKGKTENKINAIVVLKELAENGRWNAPEINEIYEKHLVKAGVPALSVCDDGQRMGKQNLNDLKDKLIPVVEKLGKSEAEKLAKALTDLWKAQDAGIKDSIKWLSAWVFSKGEKKGAFWNVGGLSLDRIATMKTVYQIKKAYKTKPEPDDITKNIPKENDHSLERFAQKSLDKMEKLREQRVKQLASRIVEAALGIGIEKKNENGKMQKRPLERIKDKRFAPCHAVVIENLENYRPEETRTRRENRQLMTWSSSKVAKYLGEACELSGLHLRQVSAGYTSRQDSRTGAPGIRCSDKPVREFIGIMAGRIAKIDENLKKGGSEEDKYLKEQYGKWDDKKSAWTDKWGGKWKLAGNKWEFGGGTRHKNINSPHPVRIPQKGGEIFVSADMGSPLKNGIQADLNAAANIGIKALLDPDWNGRWWYVPCSPKDYIPANDKVKGSEVFESKIPLLQVEKEKSEKDKEKKDIVNLWRDISGDSLYTGNWREFKPYWNDVTARAIKNLRG